MRNTNVQPQKFRDNNKTKIKLIRLLYKPHSYCIEKIKKKKTKNKNLTKTK